MSNIRSSYVVPSPISAQHKITLNIQISPFTLRDSVSWPSGGDDNLESHLRGVRTRAQVRANLSSIPSCVPAETRGDRQRIEGVHRCPRLVTGGAHPFTLIVALYFLLWNSLE